MYSVGALNLKGHIYVKPVFPHILCVFRSLRCILEDYTPADIEGMGTTFAVGLLSQLESLPVLLCHTPTILPTIVAAVFPLDCIIHYRCPGVVRQLILIQQKLKNLSQCQTGVFIRMIACRAKISILSRYMTFLVSVSVICPNLSYWLQILVLCLITAF